MMTIETFLREIKRGVNWGPKPFEVRWKSTCGRFAILRKRGHMTWAGRGATPRYVPSETVVIDLFFADSKRGSTLYLACKRHEVEGRVSNADLRQLARVLCGAGADVKVSK